MLEEIREPIPFSLETMKRIFTKEKIFPVVVYEDSKLKGKDFLNYITNINIPLDIELPTEMSDEMFEEIMGDYIYSNNISTNVLSTIFSNIMLYKKGMGFDTLPYSTRINEESLKKFVENHKNILDLFECFIDSSHVLSIYYNKNFREKYDVKKIFEIYDESVNIPHCIISLYCVPHFLAHYFYIENAEYNFKFFTKNFEEIFYNKKGICDYWHNEYNFFEIAMTLYSIGEIKDIDICGNIFKIGVFDEKYNKDK